MDCSLSLRRSPRSSRPVFQPAMQVEMLESRITPAGNAPVLTYSVLNPGDPCVTITGKVTGQNIAYSTVNFTGAVTNSVVTNATGNFSFNIAANNLGTVMGVAWNNLGVQSNVLLRSVSSQAPRFVSLTASFENDQWTFSGRIWNENLFNQTITFSGFEGLEGQTVTTDSTGDFSATFTLDSGATGTLTVMVNDCWNLSGSTQIVI